MTETIQNRKTSHVEVCLEQAVERQSPWNAVRLPHRALPELDRDAVSTSCRFLGRELRLPLLIGSMTGGTEDAGRLNRRLAEAAQRCGVGLCLGSQRIMLERPELTDTFRVREQAPDVPLVANLGAIQLKLGVTPAQVRSLVDAVAADGLVLHLNSAQEAVQEGGDTAFAGLHARLAEALPQIGVPCGVKEVGSGFAPEDVARLAQLPLAFVESAGHGGTSWPLVEGLRGQSASTRRLGSALADWGHTSVESLNHCVAGLRGVTVIASGGIRSGVDAARAVALGADLVAMALPLLRAASRSTEAVVGEIESFERELRAALFLTGSPDLRSLRGRLSGA
jgi:isopentenyl-diphosphate delta-isomerase